MNHTTSAKLLPLGNTVKRPVGHPGEALGIEFGRRLRLAIKTAGISANELARRVQTSSASMSRCLARGVPLGGDSMLLLPATLGVNAHWLFTGKGPPEPPGESPERDLAFSLAYQSAIEDMRAVLDLISDIQGAGARAAAHYSTIRQDLERLRPREQEG
jgi:hypothetical protein